MTSYFPSMESIKRLDRIFFALSDSRRRVILEELSEEKKTVSQLAESSSLTLGAISKQISLLENAELIFKSKVGRTVYCHMNFDIWKEVTAYIGMHTKFWNNRLDELEKFIEISRKR
ncbi:MAG: helix-turn-helix domain-containing protein [Kangiellaceae bacterium]|nr:helix-turn-helix domain-containing protein [Kangiellaceae bacterium]MCW9015717.1 helix-turn-helix domain-containing protein [Kangiellaceae bacterium]